MDPEQIGETESRGEDNSQREVINRSTSSRGRSVCNRGRGAISRINSAVRIFYQPLKMCAYAGDNKLSPGSGDYLSHLPALCTHFITSIVYRARQAMHRYQNQQPREKNEGEPAFTSPREEEEKAGL